MPCVSINGHDTENHELAMSETEVTSTCPEEEKHALSLEQHNTKAAARYSECMLLKLKLGQSYAGVARLISGRPEYVQGPGV